MKVCIDPGHGGVQPGCSAGGYLEKNLNLPVALKLRDKLQKVGITVVMTRTTDVDIDLTTRANISNNAKADYFISIHHNAGGGHGYEVIYALCGGKSLQLANNVAAQYDAIGQKKHNVYSKKGSDGRDYYAVIRQTTAPAIISEFGYMDTDDIKLFNTDVGQEKEADVLFEAICKQTGINIPQPVVQAPAQPSTAAFTPDAHPGYDEVLPGRRIIHLNKYTYISMDEGAETDSITLHAKGKQPKQLI